MNRLVVIIVLTFALGNIAVLDYIILTRPNTPGVQRVDNQTTPPPVDTCSGDCLKAIDRAVSAAVARVSPTAAPAPTAALLPRTSFSKSPSGEAFINIGTGSYSSEYDWGDVPGAQVSFDAGAYGQIKTAVFEATVTTPNGNEDVQLRLYNDTDKHPVWGSDLSFPSGDKVRFKVSSNMSLDPGSKIYKIQMKTQFATNANIDVARVHVTAN